MDAAPTSSVRLPQRMQAAAAGARATAGHAALAAHLVLIAATAVVVTSACHLRWSIAASTAWRCDEIPLLVRSTGLCGHVTDEREARAFRPSFYSWYMGAMRGLRAPKDIAAIHTTTNFWVNLTTHLFGVTPAAGRLMPFVFSVSAIGIAGWLTWMLVVRWTAACFAAVIVAWSPHAIAYGAQARGYAEAMALAPLLLIALEYVRRKPTSWLRAAAALLVGIELSLTVYTAWLYWTLPALVVAVLILPRATGTSPDATTPGTSPHATTPGTSPDATRRATIRLATTVIGLGLCLFMGIYTLDRWTQLTFTGANMGVTTRSWAEVRGFVADTVAHLLPVAGVVLTFAVLGGVCLRASSLRWLLAVPTLGVLTPFVFAGLNGSPGYPRNLGYLVVPLAALGAVGADAVVRWITSRLPREATLVVTAAILLGTCSWAYADGSARARAMTLPDWGAAVAAVDKRPETIGPRWFCRCLANHWQINWYRSDEDLGRFLTVPRDGHFEVVLGTQLDERGVEIVFCADSDAGAIVAAELPAYLADLPTAETVAGVNLRRWQAAGSGAVTRAGSSERPIFTLVVSPAGGVGADAIRDLLDADSRREVVTFKPLDHGGQVVHSLLLPARLLPLVRAVEESAPSAQGVRVLTFELEDIAGKPIERHPRAADKTAMP